MRAVCWAMLGSGTAGCAAVDVPAAPSSLTAPLGAVGSARVDVFELRTRPCGATLGPGHGGNTGSGRVPDACDFTYVAENNLRWALGVRFGIRTAGSAGALDDCCVPLPPQSDGEQLGGPIPDRAMVDNHAALLKAC